MRVVARFVCLALLALQIAAATSTPRARVEAPEPVTDGAPALGLALLARWGR
jgi:hypothetical protein